MKLKILFIFLFGFQLLFSQEKNVLNRSIFSIDKPFGLNITQKIGGALFGKDAPQAILLNWNISNYSKSEKFSIFGYTDYGFSFLYHDFIDKTLGKNFGIYAFMEFQLNHPRHKNRISLRISQGIAYNTNPYNKLTNHKNRLFGSHILLPFDVALYLSHPKIYKNWGAQIGLAVFHYSNGNIESPNFGANIPSFTLGVNYDFREQKDIPNERIPFPKYDKAWKYWAVMRFGMNESDYYDSGLYPFYIPAFQVEKRLSYRHNLSMGAELFLSYFLKEVIRYESEAYPEYGNNKNADFKRFGIYIGDEFVFGKYGFLIDIGYYLYYPYSFEQRFYSRLGNRFRFGKHWSGLFTLKTHSFRAEAVEFGLMYNFK